MTNFYRWAATYSRTSSIAPAELTEDFWSRWAGGYYAFEVLAHREPVSPDLGFLGPIAIAALARMKLYRRKVVCMVLFERAAQLGFSASAERYAEAYKRLDGGHPNESSKGYRAIRKTVLADELTQRFLVAR